LPQHPTDSELWTLIVDGDARAWKALISKYEALVHSVVTRVGLSYHEAADCFQQTWVLLYQSRKKIVDPARLPGWLATTARREAIKVHRRGRKHESIDELADLYVDTGALPDEELEKMELQSRLDQALAMIDDRCAKLMRAMLLDDEGESYEEIAARFGISSNALGPARRRCLDRLKVALEKVGYLPARTAGSPALSGRKTVKVYKKK
jgi:RNA polymerase sigma factor (sigma-70 family)